MEEKEKKLKIVAIQMSSKIGGKYINFDKVANLIEKNMKPDADIIILPEVWTVGWKPNKFGDTAEDLQNSETVEFLSNIARKYNSNIIGGSFITTKCKMQNAKNTSSHLTPNNLLFNTCPVFNRKGELIATYDKMHLFSYYGCDEGKFITKGEKPVLIEIDGVKIGLTICYDIRFPEIYRSYRKSGVDLLINMAAWPMSRAGHWEALTKARAIENQCFMVALTQSGPIENDEWNLGHSRIIDYNGEVISEIEDGEGAMFAEIKFKEMYGFREKCTILLDIHDSYDIK